MFWGDFSERFEIGFYLASEDLSSDESERFHDSEDELEELINLNIKSYHPNI